MRLYGIFTEGKDMSKAFDDWFDHFMDTMEYAEGSEEDDIRATFNAGRAYQREVDAELIAYMYGNGKDMAKAIREQKIDD